MLRGPYCTGADTVMGKVPRWTLPLIILYFQHLVLGESRHTGGTSNIWRVPTTAAVPRGCCADKQGTGSPGHEFQLVGAAPRGAEYDWRGPFGTCRLQTAAAQQLWLGTVRPSEAGGLLELRLSCYLTVLQFRHRRRQRDDERP